MNIGQVISLILHLLITRKYLTLELLDTTLFFQMESEVPDFVSILMANDPGGRNFFVSCLLCLNPDQLKACRLVNSAWNQFIKDEVWGKNRGRRRLESKLVEQWKSADPMTVALGPEREWVNSMFCSDAYAFCGLRSGVVRVYSLATGEWLRDLLPGQVGIGFNYTRVSGSKTVVAASVWCSKLTVWSSKGKMEQVYYLDVINHDCLDAACHHGGEKRSILAITVVGSKITLLVNNDERKKSSLVVIKRGEHIWEEKTLACFPSIPTSFLATARDWAAVAKMFATGPRLYSTKVMLWKDDTYRQDLDLLGCQRGRVQDIAMELPFLILSLWSVGESDSIKVYRLAADNRMENIGTVATPFKSIPLVRCIGIICNEFFFGFANGPGSNVILIEKRALFNAAEKETKTRQINLVGDVLTDCMPGALWRCVENVL